MKKLILLSALVITIGACKSNGNSDQSSSNIESHQEQASIVGNWRGTEFEFDQTSAENRTNQYANYPDRHPKTTLRFVDDSVFNFIVDTYTVNDTGYYEIDGDKLWLGGHVKTEYNIESVTSTTLHITEDVYMAFPSHTLTGTLHLYFERLTD